MSHKSKFSFQNYLAKMSNSLSGSIQNFLIRDVGGP